MRCKTQTELNTFFFLLVLCRTDWPSDGGPVPDGSAWLDRLQRSWSDADDRVAAQPPQPPPFVFGGASDDGPGMAKKSAAAAPSGQRSWQNLHTAWGKRAPAVAVEPWRQQRRLLANGLEVARLEMKVQLAVALHKCSRARSLRVDIKRLLLSHRRL